MVLKLTPTKFTAGLLHFFASLTLGSILLFILLGLWYPEIYFASEGGWEGIKIVVSVDLVLGPLLTLVVFDSGKHLRELVVDMTCIVVFQLIAMGYGVYILYVQRPVAVVFWAKSFITVPAQALDDQSYKVDDLAAFSGESPALIYAENPTKLDDLKKMKDLILNERIPPHHQPWLYRPLKDHFSEIKPQQVNIDEILVKNPEVKNQLLPILQENNKKIHDVFCFLLQSKYRNGILVFDSDAQYLGGISLD